MLYLTRDGWVFNQALFVQHNQHVNASVVGDNVKLFVDCTGFIRPDQMQMA
jgi:hypothetical protein